MLLSKTLQARCKLLSSLSLSQQASVRCIAPLSPCRSVGGCIYVKMKCWAVNRSIRHLVLCLCLVLIWLKLNIRKNNIFCSSQLVRWSSSVLNGFLVFIFSHFIHTHVIHHEMTCIDLMVCFVILWYHFVFSDNYCELCNDCESHVRQMNERGRWWYLDR